MPTFRKLRNHSEQLPSAFAEEVVTTACFLAPDELLYLVIWGSPEYVRAVLAGTAAARIGGLKWWCKQPADLALLAPLLTRLVRLKIVFASPLSSELDFVTDVLERGGEVRELVVNAFIGDDIPRFFAALGRSRVESLHITLNLAVMAELCSYLALDRLTCLKVRGFRDCVPANLTSALAGCTRLVRFKAHWCTFTPLVVFPKSLTTLKLVNCTLEGATISHDLDKLTLIACHYSADALIALDPGRARHLYFDLHSPPGELAPIISALCDGRVAELTIPYNLCTLLLPASVQRRTTVTKLRFDSRYFSKKNRALLDRFHARVGLQVLLQGQQVRRAIKTPLRRLPVEMLRLVGMTLI